MIDLGKCVVGQTLKSSKGLKFLYMGLREDPEYPHIIKVMHENPLDYATAEGKIFIKNPKANFPSEESIAEILDVISIEMDSMKSYSKDEVLKLLELSPNQLKQAEELFYSKKHKGELFQQNKIFGIYLFQFLQEFHKELEAIQKGAK